MELVLDQAPAPALVERRSMCCVCARAPTCTELLCKFPGEVEGDSSEVGVPQ